MGGLIILLLTTDSGADLSQLISGAGGGQEGEDAVFDVGVTKVSRTGEKEVTEKRV